LKDLDWCATDELMNDDMNRYIGSCLKNWVAKQRLPADGKIELLKKAGYPPVYNSAPFTRFFSTFSNRWSSPGEQYYSQRHWMLAGPLTQSSNWSFHLMTSARLAP
jgi:hypothetical protein